MSIKSKSILVISREEKRAAEHEKQVAENTAEKNRSGDMRGSSNHGAYSDLPMDQRQIPFDQFNVLRPPVDPVKENTQGEKIYREHDNLWKL
ncbi:hypothetical protein N7509_004610 [Penicillium cosmopolitanum]|uniref:Uncharacterized protein n=1 Tax=Penicillium cosmopolitanum TaxID=1131564 RepID=A0A9X0B9B8_9EURO|nr:uncharacterized protein N7509_004610 [Penicillium cosmopolitanum]KAJ5396497.1 hypothetical protein N7509_004610 [Penicillium cosmopolitanum]